MADILCGKWEVEGRENLEPFLKGIGVPEAMFDQIKNATVTTEIKNNGDKSFTVIRTRPSRTSTNIYKLGEDTEVENLKGEKIKVNIKLEGGKLVAKGDEYCVTSELVDGKLKESVTFKGHSMSRTFKKIC